MKVMRFLLGLMIGAGVAVLFAPKSGRELRQQLAGGVGDRLLGSSATDVYPQPEVAEPDPGGVATAFAEPEVADPVVDEATVVAEPAADEIVPKPFPDWTERPEASEGDDLRERIDETRVAVQTELAQPFAEESQGVVAEEAAAETVAEEADEETGAAAVEAVAAAEAVVAGAAEEKPTLEVAEPVEGAIEASAPLAAEAAEEPVVDAAPPAEVAVVEGPDEVVADEESVSGGAAVEKTPAETPAAEEAVVEPPAPVATEAPPEEPATETAREGGAIDQAEMRRRIEETRARLKAKAFDAMMSGEAALLARDSGDVPVPTSEEHGLDAETDSVIDESLSQEDY